MIGLTLNKEYHFLSSIETIEYVNYDLMTRILNSDKLLSGQYYAGDHYYATQKDFFMKYYKLLSKKTNLKKVEYIMPKGQEFGRAYSKMGLSIAHFSKQIRHTIAKGNYIDIDMENAHPTILLQICEQNKIECSHLKNYVDNREKIIELANPTNDKNIRESFKKLMLSYIFGSKYQKQHAFTMLNEYIENFRNEITLIAKKIYDANPEIVAQCTKNKNDNIYGSVLSIYCQEIEKRILGHMFTYLKNNNFINQNKNNVVLCWDGIMISNQTIPDTLLNDLTNYVKNNTGLTISYSYKSFDSAYTDLMTMETIIEKSKDIVYEHLDKFNKSYFHSLETYQQKKQYWEHFCSKIINDSTFIFKLYSNVTNKLEYVEYSEKNLMISFKDIRHNGDPFLKSWLSGEDMTTYTEKLFKPENKAITTNNIQTTEYFNIFNGYNPLILTETPDNYMDIIKSYLKVVKALCEDNTEYFNYYIKYLANIIQNPNVKCNVSVFFRGEEGIGKNLHLEAIANVIGKNHYLSTNKADDLFGKFSIGMSNKLIVNWNEADRIGDLIEDLKVFITEEYRVTEQKGKNKIESRNISRLIGTTNRICPFNVHGKSRRFSIFQASDKFLKQKYKDSQFFKNLAELIDTPIFIASLYKYLNEMDLINWNCNDFPQNTKALIQLRFLGKPSEISFIEHYLSTIKDLTKKHVKKGSDLYKEYDAYCIEFNLKDKNNVKMFYSKLENHNLKGITKKIAHHAISYEIQPIIINQSLIDNGFIQDENLFN